jgi:hypothetical protein
LLFLLFFPEQALTAHFSSPVSNTERSSDYIVHFRISGTTAAAGDEIAFFNPRNVLCGRYVVATPSTDGYYPVAIYGDDSAVDGETLTVKVWDADRLLELSGTSLLLTAGTSNEYYQPSAIPPVWRDKAGYVLNVDTATHFAAPLATPHVCNYMGNVVIENQPAEIGDEVAAFDQGGFLCGLARVGEGGKFSIAIYGDDNPDIGPDEGAVAGEILKFRVWDASSGTEYADGGVALSPGNSMGSEFFLPSAIPPVWRADYGYALNIASFSDNVPPTVAILTPTENSRVDQPSITLSGSAGDAATATITFNHGSVENLTLDNGSFSHPLTLVYGLNTIEVSAVDQIGNGRTLLINVFYLKRGDLNGDGALTLADALLALQVLSRLPLSTAIYRQADVNGDAVLGIEDMLYILQTLSETRN